MKHQTEIGVPEQKILPDEVQAYYPKQRRRHRRRLQHGDRYFKNYFKNYSKSADDIRTGTITGIWPPPTPTKTGPLPKFVEVAFRDENGEILPNAIPVWLPIAWVLARKKDGCDTWRPADCIWLLDGERCSKKLHDCPERCDDASTDCQWMYKESRCTQGTHNAYDANKGECSAGTRTHLSLKECERSQSKCHWNYICEPDGKRAKIREQVDFIRCKWVGGKVTSTTLGMVETGVDAAEDAVREMAFIDTERIADIITYVCSLQFVKAIGLFWETFFVGIFNALFMKVGAFDKELGIRGTNIVEMCKSAGETYTDGNDGDNVDDILNSLLRSTSDVIAEATNIEQDSAVSGGGIADREKKAPATVWSVGLRILCLLIWPALLMLCGVI